MGAVVLAGVGKMSLIDRVLCYLTSHNFVKGRLVNTQGYWAWDETPVCEKCGKVDDGRW